MKKLIAVFCVIFVVTLSLNAQDAAAPANEEKVVSATNVYNDGRVDYVSPDTKFSLEVAEDGVGAKAMYYSIDAIDSKSAKEYKAPISVKGEGKHQIYYWVLDNLGVTSKVSVYEFIIDATGPKVKIKGSKNKSKLIDNILYAAASEEFIIQATDNLSGIKSIEYSVDGGEFKEYTEAIVADFSYGMHKIAYRSTDNVGNVSDLKELSLFVDNKGPMVDIKANPEVFVKDDKKYVSERTLFSVDAEDYDSSVETILYGVDSEELVPYVIPFNLAKYEAGERKITVKVIDFAGNETTETLDVVLDKSDNNATIIPVLLQ